MAVASLFCDMPPEQTTSFICFNLEDPALRDLENVVTELPKQLLDFIDSVPPVIIAPENVKSIDVSNFEKVLALQVAMIGELRKDMARLQAELSKVHEQAAEQAAYYLAQAKHQEE